MKKFFFKRILPALFAVSLLAWPAMTGCSTGKPKSGPAITARPAAGQTNLVIAPTGTPTGRVASFNPQSKIVVVSFPVGQLPALDTRLAVFHAGQKIGTLKLSGPQADTFIVGDLISGTAGKDDEVRAE